MERPFVWNIKVSSYDTDMNAVMSPQNKVKYLMEAAIEHTERAGYPVEKLLEMKRGWVVLNWVIRVDKYPAFGDNLEIRTWARYGSTLQATRYFIVSRNGENIASAASRWAFLDLEKRHPVRFSKEMEEAYCCDMPAPSFLSADAIACFTASTHSSRCFLICHSQKRRTVHPASWSWCVTALSLSMFRSILGTQYSRLDLMR